MAGYCRCKSKYPAQDCHNRYRHHGLLVRRHRVGTVSAPGIRDYGFQVSYAEQIRRDAQMPAMAVGLIVDPSWPLHAQKIATQLRPISEILIATEET